MTGPVTHGRPSIDPGVAAAIVARSPARIVARLDREPALAEQWEWAGDAARWTVRAGDDAVTIEAPGGRVEAIDGIACTCLLAPRCLHILAVTSRLAPTGDEPAATDEELVAESEESVEPAAGVVLTDEHRAAARRAWAAGARTLMAGGTATGAVAQGELLRAAHACRTAGLHRLAAGTTRLVGHLRALADDRPEFELASLTDAVRELLELSHVVAGHGRPVQEGDVGTARRAYHGVGAMELRGFCTEPVLTATGFAGVVTHLLGGQGRLLTVSDVMPGGEERVHAAYGSPVRLGPVSLRHRDLCRRRLITHRLALSDDGRISGGGGVEAADIGPSSWDDPALVPFWNEPVAAQLGRGADLLFVSGQPLGATPEGLMLLTDAGPFHVVAPSDHEVFPYGENLRLLAGAQDGGLRVIGRPVLARPRTLIGVAAGFSLHTEAGKSFPEAWMGFANLGLDRLSQAHVPGRGAPTMLRPPPHAPSLDLLRPLELRVQRLAMGGWMTLGDTAGRAVDADVGRLARVQLQTGARLLQALHRAVLTSERAVGGEGLRPRPDDVARAWLATATYLSAARLTLARAAWAA